VDRKTKKLAKYNNLPPKQISRACPNNSNLTNMNKMNRKIGDGKNNEK